MSLVSVVLEAFTFIKNDMSNLQGMSCAWEASNLLGTTTVSEIKLELQLYP